MPIPAALLGVGTIGFAAYLLFGNNKKKVFISYYSDEDGHYKRLLKAWSQNKKFKLEFDDKSTDININSNNDDYIRRKIKERIADSQIFIVFIGKNTHKRKWVIWEIEKAKQLNKKIIAIKEKREYRSPQELKSCGAIWIYGFNAEKIYAALEE